LWSRNNQQLPLGGGIKFVDLIPVDKAIDKVTNVGKPKIMALEKGRIMTTDQQ